MDWYFMEFGNQSTSVELMIIKAENHEWVSARQVASLLLRMSEHTLRKELNARDWRRLLAKDRNVLQLLANHGLLGDGEACQIGKARSANLISLESLPALVKQLRPRDYELQSMVFEALVRKESDSRNE